MRDEACGYCDAAGLPALREALSRRFADLNGVDIGADAIFVTPGSCQAIAAVLLSVACDGGAALLPRVHWPMHLQQVLMAGLRPRFYDNTDERIRMTDALDEAYDPAARVLIVNSPANPSGQVLTRPALEEVYDWAGRRGVSIISDEAYEDFVFEGELPALTRLDAMVPPRERVVFSVHTFSKGYSMTGYRLGYVSAPTPERAQLLQRVQEAVLVSPNTPVQFAGLAALADRDHLRRHHEYVRSTRDAVVAMLRPTQLMWSVPRGGWYALLDVARCGPDSETCCLRLLRDDGVALAPGRGFVPSGDPLGPRLVRVALCGERTRTLTALGIVSRSLTQPA